MIPPTLVSLAQVSSTCQLGFMSTWGRGGCGTEQQGGAV